MLMLRQPKHIGVGSGISRLVPPESFEALSTIATSVIKICAVSDDFKIALGILEVAGYICLSLPLSLSLLLFPPRIVYVFVRARVCVCVRVCVTYSLFYRESPSGLIYLSKRLEVAEMWKSQTFWEWSFEDKLEHLEHKLVSYLNAMSLAFHAFFLNIYRTVHIHR